MKKFFLIVLLVLVQASFGIPIRLHNFGSTCYLNSTIQCLYNTDVITNFALYTYRIDPYQPESLASLYIKLVHAMNNLPPQNSPTYAQAEQKFWNNELTNFAHKAYDVMGSCGQQDAPEFLVKLIDSLISQDKRYKASTPEEQLRTHPLGKNIKIEGITTLHCPTVNYKSTKKELFRTLDIETHKYVNGTRLLLDTLEKCLDEFFAQEKLDDYTPEGRTVQHDCTKKIELTALSDVVIIVPKRFTFDFTTFERIKLDHIIAIPLTMNFRKYFSSSAQSQPMYNYDLIAAAEHMGVAEGGHYIAHIKDIKTDQWYYCSDTYIQTESRETAQAGINRSYILIYRKSTKKS